MFSSIPSLILGVIIGVVFHEIISRGWVIVKKRIEQRIREELNKNS